MHFHSLPPQPPLPSSLSFIPYFPQTSFPLYTPPLLPSFFILSFSFPFYRSFRHPASFSFLFCSFSPFSFTFPKQPFHHILLLFFSLALLPLSLSFTFYTCFPHLFLFSFPLPFLFSLLSRHKLSLTSLFNLTHSYFLYISFLHPASFSFLFLYLFPYFPYTTFSLHTSPSSPLTYSYFLYTSFVLPASFSFLFLPFSAISLHNLFPTYLFSFLLLLSSPSTLFFPLPFHYFLYTTSSFPSYLLQLSLHKLPAPRLPLFPLHFFPLPLPPLHHKRSPQRFLRPNHLPCLLSPRSNFQQQACQRGLSFSSSASASSLCESSRASQRLRISPFSRDCESGSVRGPGEGSGFKF